MNHTMTQRPLYELVQLPFDDFSGLQSFFNNLPENTYADYRRRSSRFSFNYGRLTRHRQKDFMQSSDINSCEEIEDGLLENPIFLEMFKEFTRRTALGGDDVIEAHLIRFHCPRNTEETPEGVHQDGSDVVGMFNVDLENGRGGAMQLFEAPDKPPFFEKVLDAGEFVVVDDRALYHNSAPLFPTHNDREGHWDVIIFTANRGS